MLNGWQRLFCCEVLRETLADEGPEVMKGEAMSDENRNVVMSRNYDPRPVDVSAVSLPDELNGLIEALAENVHDTWARGRLDQGWQWGKERNDDKKENPCLVPYDQLPDTEKEYDRATAISTLKVISKMGFKIVKG